MGLFKNPGRKIPVTISIEEEKIAALQLVMIQELGLGISRSKAVQIAIDRALHERGIVLGVDIRAGDTSGVMTKMGITPIVEEAVEGLRQGGGGIVPSRNQSRPTPMGTPEEMAEIDATLKAMMGERREAEQERMKALGTPSIVAQMIADGIFPDSKTVNEPSGEAV